MAVPGPHHLGTDAALQIAEVRAADETGATVAVRCVRGPVRLGARFDRIGGTAPSIDLELTRILFYGHPVDGLGPGDTALVTLSGTGSHHLRAGDTGSGWQTLQGTSPAFGTSSP